MRAHAAPSSPTSTTVRLSDEKSRSVLSEKLTSTRTAALRATEMGDTDALSPGVVRRDASTVARTAVTLGIRSVLMPINLGTMRNSARMAKMQPELKVLQERMKADPNASDMKRQQMYSKQFNALFEKYQCHPFKSLRFPLIQLPVFTSMYFGLNRISEVYPDVATGGALFMYGGNIRFIDTTFDQNQATGTDLRRSGSDVLGGGAARPAYMPRSP